MAIAHHIISVGLLLSVMLVCSKIMILLWIFFTYILSISYRQDNRLCTFCLPRQIFTCRNKQTSAYFEYCINIYHNCHEEEVTHVLLIRLLLQETVHVSTPINYSAHQFCYLLLKEITNSCLLPIVFHSQWRHIAVLRMSYLPWKRAISSNTFLLLLWEHPLLSTFRLSASSLTFKFSSQLTLKSDSLVSIWKELKQV